MAIVRAEEGIRFEGVGFRYPGKSAPSGAEAAARESERWALRDVNVFIPKGQSLALVGENGAGKTTFIKLLARLYQPTEGRVLLDGRDLATWDEAELRRRIGVIFQDFNEYQLALRENVGFGSVEHLGDELRIGRAVERGGARELAAGLPAGLETQLGRWFTGGVELSGGQWQKVALARAFMREEADILILDEPTAALDAEAEHAVFERFRALAAGHDDDPDLAPLPDGAHGGSHPGARGRARRRGRHARRAGRRRRAATRECSSCRPPAINEERAAKPLNRR